MDRAVEQPSPHPLDPNLSNFVLDLSVALKRETEDAFACQKFQYSLQFRTGEHEEGVRCDKNTLHRENEYDSPDMHCLPPFCPFAFEHPSLLRRSCLPPHLLYLQRRELPLHDE